MKKLNIYILGQSAILALFSTSCYAMDLGQAASNMANTLDSVSSLIQAVAFICGLGYLVSAIMKFKKHRESPQQVPMSTPVTELAMALVLMLVPMLANLFGLSVFGEDAQKASGNGAVEYVTPQKTPAAPPASTPAQQPQSSPDDATQQENYLNKFNQ